MAVTNNLLIFAADTTNKMDDATYSSNSQRESGCQADQVVSSSLYNTTLRSITLIQKALVSSLGASSDGTGGTWSTNIEEADAKSQFDALFGGLNVNSAAKDGDGAVIKSTYAAHISKTVDATTKSTTVYLKSKTNAILESIDIESVNTAKNADQTAFTNNSYRKITVGNSGMVDLGEGLYHIMWTNGDLDNNPSRIVNMGVVNLIQTRGSMGGYGGTFAFGKDYDDNEYILTISGDSLNSCTLWRKTSSQTSFARYDGGYIYAKPIA